MLGMIICDIVFIRSEMNDLKNNLDVLNYRVPQFEIKIQEVNIKEETTDDEVVEQIITEVLPTTEELPLCNAEHSSFKSYMDYRCVTDRTSPQYQLIYSDDIVVGDDGLLYYGEYVGIATGSRFGNVGDKFIITLDSGNEFKAIKLDEKSDAHTINGCHHANDGSIIEFVVDVAKVRECYPDAIYAGSFNVVDQYSGVVTQILRVID